MKIMKITARRTCQKNNPSETVEIVMKQKMKEVQHAVKYLLELNEPFRDEV